MVDDVCVATSFHLTITGRQLDLEGFLVVAMGNDRNPVASSWLVEMTKELKWPGHADRFVDV